MKFRTAVEIGWKKIWLAITAAAAMQQAATACRTRTAVATTCFFAGMIMALRQEREFSRHES
jgi:hypothetical protein